MLQGKNLSESIADIIKGKIMTGEFPIGSQLPNEQELSANLNVSRTTIREAVKLLVSLHVLEIERGRGTFVAAIPGLSDDPFGLDFVPEKKLLSDIYEFRNTIEQEVCALAAVNATKRQLSEMKKLVDHMETTASKYASSGNYEEQIDKFTNDEMHFHALVYKMTHNVLFDRLSNTIMRAVVLSYTSISYREGFDFVRNARIHKELYLAIAAKDAKSAKELGEIHMKDFCHIF